MAVQNKVIMGAVSALTILLIGGASMSAFAQGNNSDGSLVDKVASKFNLNKQEVQSVFDEDRQAHQAEQKAERSTELQSKVDDGTITAEQKTAIEKKLEEMHTSREQSKVSLEEWAKQNNIDAKYVMMGGRGGMQSSRLQKAVDSGAITADQKAIIEQKQQEMKATFDAERESMQKWATDNGIDESAIMRGDGNGGKMGGRGMMDKN
ncbi:MAG: hypothetical protein QG647_694 [Patescibacteria group bacterium]|nr:hypothetical protein [Patescibacteria group bacterium]